MKSSQIVRPTNTTPSITQPPGLYMVATPIGNLKDITLRALETLQFADLIACEDTRVTGKLLNHYGISAPMISYNDHNAKERRPEIILAIEQGKRVILVSDAGTPLISDPGYKLIRELIDKNLYFTILPGPSSPLAALCLSGLPTDRFLFAGFLPTKENACRKTLEELGSISATLMFFESGRRITETLEIAHNVLGARQAAVARELTKLYEEVKRGTLKELADFYKQNSEPKGEMVLVIAPPEEQEVTTKTIETQLRHLLKSHSVKEAASILAEQTGQKRKEIYALALKIMDE